MNLIPVRILDGGQATNALDRNGRWILLAAAVLCALLFQESAFLLVAVGFIWRLFTLLGRKATAFQAVAIRLAFLVLRS
jgi:Zn-dependent protease